MAGKPVLVHAKVVIQKHPETGDKNVAFVLDPLTEIKDCVIDSGGWGNNIVVADVQLVAEQHVLDALGEQPFFCDSFQDIPLDKLSDSAQAFYRAKLGRRSERQSANLSKPLPPEEP